MSKIIDLDILRPEPQIIKIGGKEIDVSFIPCGITFELDAIVKELVLIDRDKVQEDRDEMEKAFNLGVRLCSTFCKIKYPEMDEDWFVKNTTSEQVTGFANEIQKSLMKAYGEIGRHSKN